MRIALFVTFGIACGFVLVLALQLVTGTINGGQGQLYVPLPGLVQHLEVYYGQ